MLAENLRQDSVTEAFQKTFDGKHPCGLCKAVTEGRRSEKKAEFPAPLMKIEFVSERIAFVFSAPQDFEVLPERAFHSDNFSKQPPVPPPRNCFV